MASKAKNILNWPNLFSFIRAAATAVVVWLILNNLLVSAAIVFGIACWTDWADGFLARQLNQHSSFGELLDPIADKIFLTGTFIALGIIDYIPLWVVILVITRDIILFLGGVIIKVLDLKISLKPILVSKLNTVLQMFLVVTILAFQTPATTTYPPSGVLNIIMLAFLYGVVIMTFLSGVIYAWLSGLQLARNGRAS